MISPTDELILPPLFFVLLIVTASVFSDRLNRYDDTRFKHILGSFSAKLHFLNLSDGFQNKSRNKSVSVQQ